MSPTPIDGAVIELLTKSKPSVADAVSSASTSDPVAISAAYFGITYTADEGSTITEYTTTIDAADESAMAARLNTFLANRTTILGAKPSLADVSVYRLLAPLVARWSADERTGEDGKHHVVRFVDFVQNAPLYGPLAVEKKVSIDPGEVVVPIKPVDLKAERERKKKEKEAAATAAATTGAQKECCSTAGPAKDSSVDAVTSKLKDASVAEPAGTAAAAAAAGGGAAAAAGGDDKPQPKEKKKKEKKEKKPAPPVVEKLVGPSMIDLRVGHILKAVCHPNADSLYVSTMDCGDSAGTDNTSFSDEFGKTVRTVCSGLNGLVPLEEMQGRKVVAVCNLKPVTMRGVKSCAMVLAASPRDRDGHDGPVELVSPPADSVAGERVYFDGWAGEPEGVLNPKKKIWEAVQPGFLTNDKLEVGFDPKATESEPILQQAESKPGVAVLRTKGGVCTVKSLVNATVR